MRADHDHARPNVRPLQHSNHVLRGNIDTLPVERDCLCPDLDRLTRVGVADRLELCEQPVARALDPANGIGFLGEDMTCVHVHERSDGHHQPIILNEIEELVNTGVNRASGGLGDCTTCRCLERDRDRCGRGGLHL